MIFAVSGPTEGFDINSVHAAMDLIEMRQANRGEPLSRYIGLGFKGVDAMVLRYSENIAISVTSWCPPYESTDVFKSLLDAYKIGLVIIFRSDREKERDRILRELCLNKGCKIAEVSSGGAKIKVKYIRPREGHAEIEGGAIRTPKFQLRI